VCAYDAGVNEDVLTPRGAAGSRAQALTEATAVARFASARWWLRGFALVLLVLAAYAPVLRGGFVWDDTVLVDRNSLVTGDASLGTIWFTEDFPLSVVALWLQWLAWGKQATGYHVVNVLLHAAGVLLVWRVLARLQVRGAWLAAALFAVHPVCVASAGWISEIKNTLSLVFFLMSFLCYLKIEDGDAASKLRTPNSELRNRKSYWLSLGAFLLALLSKTSTVMLPVVLLGGAWWSRGRLTRRDFFRIAPFFALALAFGLMTVWFQTRQVIGGEAVQPENFWGRLAGAGWALWFYLGKILLPLNLSLIYPRWQIPATSPIAWLPLLLWCALLGVGWWFRRGWGRHVLFALGAFTVTLFPALGFLDMYFLLISRVSDHFQYLSLIAVLALAAAALTTWLPGKVWKPVAAALVLVLAVLTCDRARVFATDESLWRDTLAKNPAAWPAHNNLGCIFAEQQKLDDAIRQFTASLELRANNADAQRNLGRALVLQNRMAEAEAPLRTAVRLKPEDPEAHQALAGVLQSQGHVEAAIAQLRRATRGKPNAEARLQWAALLRGNGDFRGAVEQCRQALAAKPDSVEALNNLAWMLATHPDADVRNGAEAVRFAERACHLTANTNALILGTLAAAYAETERFTNAVTAAEKAVELAQAGGNIQFAAMIQQLLRLYRARLPYHEPATQR
jgi:Flp pilus assembly protein TadD